MSGGLGIPLIDFSDLKQSIGGLAKLGQVEEAQRLWSQQLDAAQAAQGQQGGALPPLGSSAQPMTPQGAGATKPASLPFFARAQGVAPTGKLSPLIADVATRNEINPDYLQKLVQVESGGNPNAVSPTGAKGLTQFTRGTAKAYGLTDPFDPAANLQAAARLTIDNRAALARVLGRTPTDGELYLAHQQGAGGAAKILANPNATMGQLGLGQAAAVNGGSPGMSAGEFAQKWVGRFDGMSSPASAPVTRVAQAAPVAPAAHQAAAPTGLPSFASAPAFAGAVPAAPGAVAAADMPAPGARPTAGYAIPGTDQIVPAPGGNDFVPGTVASPALAQSGASAAPPLAAAPAQRLTPAQAQNLRAMLRNPLTQGYAAKIIEGLNKPEEYTFHTAGDQIYRTTKSGRAELVSNVSKPPTFQTVKGSDGNDYTFNPQTGQWVRAIEGTGGAVRNLTTPEERDAYNIPRAYTGPAQVGADNKVQFPGAGQLGISGQQKAEDAASVKGAQTLVERFDAVGKEGQQGRQDLPLISEMRSLSGDIGTGAAAAIQAKLGEYGIKLGDNAGKIEAFNALVDRLTPQQRIPGAGATSDFDARMFKGSLPRLINTPEGNALITDTLEAMAKDRIARGDIADRALLGPDRGGITAQEAMAQLRALPSIRTPFAQRMQELQKSGKLSAGAPAPNPSGDRRTPGALDVGASTVIEGVTIKRIR
ncbi:transglycosylase SLT domain-containing protein [Methylobacterium sp. Gmos1]